MEPEDLDRYYAKFKYGEEHFHYLMRHRIQEILLVSTFYDAYTFEHDSQLSEQIVGDFLQLNLTKVPRITAVTTGKAALMKLEKHAYDLIIITMRTGDLSPFTLSEKIRDSGKQTPIILLLTVKSDISLLLRKQIVAPLQGIDDVFLWTGNSKLFVAIVKSIEDRINCQRDTEIGLVRVILLIEDSIAFRSFYLPLLYREVMLQTQRLISEELNNMQKYYRMRTRPKILLARNYEEAMAIVTTYQSSLLGIVSDIRFPRKGQEDPKAGLHFLEEIASLVTVPVLLQSYEESVRQYAQEKGIDFIHKGSPTLASDLRTFFLKRLGFGDFIFYDNEGAEIARARTMRELEGQLPTVSLESLLYHADRNHFSNWLIARGEVQVARNMKPIRNKDFNDREEIRAFLTKEFHEVGRRRNRGRIVAFSPNGITSKGSIVTIRDGSLGGKGRGLAFINALMTTMESSLSLPNVHVGIPSTAIIGTAEYDQFIADHNIYQQLESQSDEQIRALFKRGALSKRTQGRLRTILEHVRSPLAVRSSGLLEDSQTAPFAGIYETHMVANAHPDIAVRLQELTEAIKLVYASTFLTQARSYIENLNYHIHEEKMAIIIQEVAGELHGDLYYPHFSGVAQSHNYYPTTSMRYEDTVASLAVGLGETVAEGERCFHYSPAHPTAQILATDELILSSQRRFYAIPCSPSYRNHPCYRKGLVSLTMDKVQETGIFSHLSSVWDGYSLRPNTGQKGTLVIDFANIVKYDYFPINDILARLLTVAKLAMGTPVEIEFAVVLGEKEKDETSSFYVLQVRPMGEEFSEDNLMPSEQDEQDRIFLSTEHSMGHGKLDSLCDIIYLNPQSFDKTRTLEMQQEIESFNKEMVQDDKHYLLIGPGRWGTRDRFLGIPTRWGQISHALAIVEVGLEAFDVEPSKGSHFLHNLIAMRIGYFYVPFSHERKGQDFIDWEWLDHFTPKRSGEFFRYISLPHPLSIHMNGRTGCGLILKPLDERITLV